MRPKAERHGIDLSLDRAVAARCLMRVAQVARVLLNLIDNAIRHTPAGGSVIVRAVVHPGAVQIQVNDAGPGLSAATQAIRPRPAVTRSSPRGRDDGGLVIARTIVEAHGGRLWAGAAARGASVRF